MSTSIFLLLCFLFFTFNPLQITFYRISAHIYVGSTVSCVCRHWEWEIFWHAYLQRLFKISPPTPRKSYEMGSDLSFSEFCSPCISEPLKKPYWEKSNQIRKMNEEHEKRKTWLIVATILCLQCPRAAYAIQSNKRQWPKCWIIPKQPMMFNAKE